MYAVMYMATKNALSWVFMYTCSASTAHTVAPCFSTNFPHISSS